MFPNAPEKAQTVACFRALNPEMPMNAVVQRFVEQNPKHDNMDAGAVLVMALIDAHLAQFEPAVLVKKKKESK
jgi:hypothetical protein